MLLSQVVRVVTRFVGRSTQFHSRELRTVEQMRALLERERSRADRTDDKFSLITFAPRAGQPDRAAASRLVTVLHKRLRLNRRSGLAER